MKNQQIKFKKIQTKKVPTKITFKTKDGSKATFKATKVVAVKKAVKKQIYVLALKETKEMPPMYIKLEDTAKFVNYMSKHV